MTSRTQLYSWYQIYVYRAPNFFSRDYEFLYSCKLRLRSYNECFKRAQKLEQTLNQDCDCVFKVSTVFLGLTLNT